MESDLDSTNIEIERMEKKKKELLVLKVHTNEISKPKGTNNVYRTRAPWTPNGRLAFASYDKLIDELYKHYYENCVSIPTFEESFYDWVNRREKSGTIEYLTAVHYRDDYKKYFGVAQFTNLPIDKITKAQIISFFECLAGDGSNVSKKAISNVKTIINGAFDNANLIDGINCINPHDLSIRDIKCKCDSVDNSKNVYSEKDAETLVAYISQLPNQNVYSLAIQLAFCLPVRISELTAITWDDVDFENRQLYLRHTMVTKKVGDVNRKRVDVNYMKKHSEASKRIIDLSDYAFSIIEKLKNVNGSKKYVLNSTGELPITTNNFNEHLRRYCNETGVVYRSSHKIRFRACSKMYDAGVDEKTIQYLMGHSSIEMTRHYDRRVNKKLDNNQLNSVFGFNFPELPS